MRRADK